MKVAIVNASARENGNSSHAANFIYKEILSRWPDAVVARVNLSEMDIHPCMGDAWCRRNDECLQDDDMRWIIKLYKKQGIGTMTFTQYKVNML